MCSPQHQDHLTGKILKRIAQLFPSIIHTLLHLRFVFLGHLPPVCSCEAFGATMIEELIFPLVRAVRSNVPLPNHHAEEPVPVDTWHIHIGQAGEVPGTLLTVLSLMQKV
ncbi:hypothetical protein E2C01_037839 [Portunus trituberculatus]|uniref:Uncharacterized protein n=1 Tax=Portunus trituberculatus TaxID=210409 RepID=A0A5B7FF49_PORTR|nr:hypothetical protein [Portunus trituberculatus]